MTARLDVHSLGVQIDRSVLLTDVDLSVDPGEWVGLIGPNGAGKTTLLHAVMGIVDAFGTISIGDQDLTGMAAPRRARSVALVPQRPTVPLGMEALAYVLLGRTPHLGYFESEDRHDLDVSRAAMAELGVAQLAERDVSTLSGGELQRVVLARAIAQEADVLLLDEPTSALDVGNQQQVLEVIDGLRSSRRLTVLSAIHDLTLAAQFCDRLVLLSDGRVAASGPANTVLTEETLRVHYDANVNIVWIDDQLAVIPTRNQNGVDSNPR